MQAPRHSGRHPAIDKYRCLILGFHEALLTLESEDALAVRRYSGFSSVRHCARCGALLQEEAKEAAMTPEQFEHLDRRLAQIVELLNISISRAVDMNDPYCDMNEQHHAKRLADKIANDVPAYKARQS